MVLRTTNAPKHLPPTLLSQSVSPVARSPTTRRTRTDPTSEQLPRHPSSRKQHIQSTAGLSGRASVGDLERGRGTGARRRAGAEPRGCVSGSASRHRVARGARWPRRRVRAVHTALQALKGLLSRQSPCPATLAAFTAYLAWLRCSWHSVNRHAVLAALVLSARIHCPADPGGPGRAHAHQHCVGPDPRRVQT